MTKLSLLAAAAAFLIAGPAAAQTRDSATNVALAILDDCVNALRGGTPFDTVMSRKGFNRASNGGWVSGVLNSVVVASSGPKTLQGGIPAQLCVITVGPATTDMAGLEAAVAGRARPWNLQYIAPGPGNGGGTMSGWANLQGQGLIAITINAAPASGGAPSNTTLSAIWR